MNRVRTLAMTCSMYYYYYYEPQSRFARRLRTVHYELHDSSIVLKSFTMVRSLKYQTGDCQCLPALRRRQRTFADILAALRRLVATALWNDRPHPKLYIQTWRTWFRSPVGLLNTVRNYIYESHDETDDIWKNFQSPTGQRFRRLW